MRHSILSLGGILAFSSFACTSSIVVDEAAVIACASSAECPANYVCQTTVSRCFLASSNSGASPSAVTTSVSPSLVSALGTFVARFEVDRELAVMPTVRAVQSSEVIALPVVQASITSFSVSYTFQPGDSEGAYEVIADLVSADGSASTDVSLGSVTYDATPPELVTTSTTFVGSPGNPLGDQELVAARTDTETVVLLTANEGLSEAVLAPVEAVEELRFVSAATTDPAVFESSVLVVGAGGILNGAIETTVTLIDLAGNSTTATGPTIAIAETAPGLTVNEAQFQFVRSPFGNAAAEEFDAGFTLPSGPHSQLAPTELGIETMGADTFVFQNSSAILRLRIWANAEATTLIGTVSPNPDGSWPRSFFDSVPERAWLTAVDGAGNDSAPVAVRNYEWISTLNGTLASTGPNRLDLLPSGDDLLSFAVSTPVRDGAKVNGLDREFLVQEFAAKFDRRALASERPEIRGRASSSYDRERGVLVLFGGITPSGASGDLWEWDERWVQRFPAGAVPDNRSGAMMVFDGARGVTVLFGGEVGGSPADDTWTWNGSVWDDLTPETSATARRDAMMAYDPVEGFTLLFGGFDASGSVLGDTWLWDGFDWTLQTPTSTPPARALGAMEFSPASGGILLFGGEDSAAQRLDDTWLWTGGDWQPLSPSTTPPARSRARLVRVGDAADPAPAEPQLIGGRLGSANDYVWTGSDWQIARAADDAASYESPWVGYHEARDTLLYFSGIDPTIFSQYYEELLILNGNQWQPVSPTTVQPPPYRANMLAYYPDAEASVFYGGYIQSQGSTSRFNDVYTWNGRVWRDITSSATPVAAGRHSAVLYYDANSRALSVYSGSTSGPFDHRALLFSSGDFSWLARGLLSTNPGEMVGYAAAYGPGNVVVDYLYLFPTNNSTLWRYDGLFWSVAPTSTPSPPQRVQAAMVVDTERREVLLFGGRAGTERNDLWIYDIDGEAWREEPIVAPWPAPRSEHRMVYVPESDSTFLLFGGQDLEAPRGDLWRWNGSAWSPVPIDGPRPAARRDFGLTYDSGRGVLVVVSGSIGGGSGTEAIEVNDTWELTLAGDEAPAIQSRISLAEGRFPLSSVTDLRVRAWCAADYPPSITVNRGADLRLWRSFGAPEGAGWQTVDRNDAGLVGLGDPALEFSESSVPLQYVIGSDAAVALQCRLTDESPTSDGRVGLDYAEVRVQYTLP